MPDLIDRFAASYFTLRSISERRQRFALQALRNYEESLSVPIEQAADQELREHMALLLRGGLKASTVNWKLEMIRPFYRWAYDERLIDSEQFMRIRAVAPPRGYNNQLPRPYSRRELMRLWANLNAKFPRMPESTDQRTMLNRWRNGTGRYARVRTHAMRLQLEAMIELALVCGLRRIEIYRLSIDDCHWDNKYIVVHGKRENQNDKTREVPYADSTREAIRAWFRMRGFMGATHDSLWLSVNGPDPLVALRWNRMEKILRSVGPYAFHRLRHTCATERLRAGMPIDQLQKFLGHANIEMTLAYAKIVREDVHEAAEKTDAAFQRAIRAA